MHIGKEIAIKLKNTRIGFKSIPLWIIPLILSILFFSLKDATIFLDSEWYLTNALNIHKGYGYVETDLSPVVIRGPVFPFLIAFSFKIFGVSIKSAFLVVRLFYLLNIMLMYFIGEKFYGKWVGLASSLLAFSSFTINRWASYVLLDNVLPFFTILSILLVFVAFEKGKYVWFALAGLCLGIAFLVKEVAILFLPLPFIALVLIKGYRSKEHLFKSLTFLGAFSLTLTPWMAYVFNASSDPLDIFGTGKYAMREFLLASKSRESLSLYQMIIKGSFLVWLADYYRYIVARNFVLAPLFLIAWAFTLLSAILRKSKPDRIMMFSFLLFSPIMVFEGKIGGVVFERQGVILFLLSYIALSNFLLASGGYILTKLDRVIANRRLSLITHRIGLAILISAVIIVEIQSKTATYFVENSVLVRFMLNKDTRRSAKMFGGRNIEPIRMFSEGMLKNIPPKSRILTSLSSQQVSHRLIYFFTNGEYYIADDMPLINSTDYESEPSPDRSQTRGQEERTLYLGTYGHRANLQSYLTALTEEDLLGIIERESIDYILLTEWGHYLSFYLQRNPNFVKLMELGQEIQVYQVNGVKPYDFETVIGRNASPFLNNVRGNNPARYNRVKDRFLKERLGWTDEKIERLMSNPNSFTFAF